MSLLIYGRNSVIAACNSNRVNFVYLSNGLQDKKLIQFLKGKNISTKFVTNNELNKFVGKVNHQGIVASVNEEYKYYSLLDLINDGKKINNPIIIMLDGIEDPHNLGAILRIADAYNVLGIIIKKNNQVGLNATVAKVSTGAINYVKVSQVSNLNDTILKLKKEGYWIVSTDGEAKQPYFKNTYNMPVVLIIGSEGKGISRLVKENSDFLVNIPMFGHVNSLNASNALSVVLSFIVNSRISS